ncbi:MAG: glutamate racemase [Taibaiella sp.]|nr:glutamate racemase [Taibaiella sp.]
MSDSTLHKPIGIFDSGYGGLTVFKAIAEKLPDYDYIYLGDNSRAPYGNRSFDTVHNYTLQCVKWFFAQGCPLVILACNTASAKALRTIQQKDLPFIAPANRVLGVIRPTAEVIGKYTRSKKVGIMGTTGTISSDSYRIEIGHFFPDITVYQQACPMLVPLIENGEHESAGADYFVKKYVDALLAQCADIDTILLACTHYPLVEARIRKFLPAGIEVISQGHIVANSLADYLERHQEMESLISRNGITRYYTTDDPIDFDQKGSLFRGDTVRSEHVAL